MTARLAPTPTIPTITAATPPHHRHHSPHHHHHQHPTTTTTAAISPASSRHTRTVPHAMHTTTTMANGRAHAPAHRPRASVVSIVEPEKTSRRSSGSVARHSSTTKLKPIRGGVHKLAHGVVHALGVACYVLCLCCVLSDAEARKREPRPAAYLDDGARPRKGSVASSRSAWTADTVGGKS